MLSSEYMELNICNVELDYENPRIAKYIEMYGKDKITSEALSLILGGGTDDKNGTSYSSLKESIKSNGGIIHPIIVNKITSKNKYVVIEGNTRVQIYKELLQAEVEGEWNIIRAIVYDDLDETDIHAIRLQSHLVGPRDWDPYSKAKYLNYLSNKKKLPITLIISFCGGKQSEVKKMIDAYNDMEEYYRRNLSDDSEFDQRKFSAFSELQNQQIKETLLKNGYSKNDFAKWVINGNFDTMQSVRQLPAILNNKDATKVFFDENAKEAMKVVAAQEISTKSYDSNAYESIAAELLQKLDSIEYKEIKKLRDDPDYENKKSMLITLYETLDTIVKEISEED